MANLPTQPTKLDFIDSLRGLAIILVVLVHVGDILPNLSRGMLTFSDSGRFGVQLFFIVSAFTLCHTMSGRKEDHPLTKFYLRRYFRIAPLYYFGILFYLCFYSLKPMLDGQPPLYASQYTLENIFVNFIFMHDLKPGAANNTIVPGGWSIGTEATFYLLFPALFVLYNRIKENKAALLALPFLGLVLSTMIVSLLQYLLQANGGYNLWKTLKADDFLYYSILCQLPVFLLGMSLFYLSKKDWIKSKTTLFLLFAAFSGLALYLLLNFESHFPLTPFASGLSFVALFLFFRQMPSLSPQWLRRIGQLSYSIYLFHFVFVYAGTNLIHKALIKYFSSDMILFFSAGIVLCVTIIVALLSERFIEKPGIELGKSLIKRLKTKSSTYHSTEMNNGQIFEKEIFRNLKGKASF